MIIFHIKEAWIVFLVLAAINGKVLAQNPNFHIYICFGQSNMEGQGPIENKDLQANLRFKTFQALDCPNLGRIKYRWYVAVPPTCQCYSKLSIADYFGKTMIANLPDSISIGIINVSVGGCDIRLFDKDIYHQYDSTYTESWFTSKIQLYNGNPYQYIIDLARMAQKDGVIKGILLHQGETNTGQEMWPSYVKKIYFDMLADLSLKASEVPLLAGEVLSVPGSCCSAMNEIIWRLRDSIATAHVISSAGCRGMDNAHFDSEGYRELGRRYAMKMLSLMSVNKPTPTPVNRRRK
ncbi:MAG: sialate O-acetylesterase [Cytophagaceae bacterium]|nr:sialate O-acetylesterase [Cytophagaceae bacterium]MDW8456316.1 sialate O-acetylesterase [Cytophagaceae bacterium]